MSPRKPSKRNVIQSFSPDSEDKAKKILVDPSVADLLSTIDCLKTSVDTLESKVSELSSILTSFKKEMDDLHTQLKGEISDVRTDFEGKLDVVNHTLLNQATSILSCKRDIERLQNERKIVVSGVPMMKGENVYNIFQSICTQLNYTNVPVVSVRRFKPKEKENVEHNNNSDVKPAVFVEFALKSEKQNFMHRYFKSADLKLDCIGMANGERIYINDRLTKKDMDIKKKALQLKKDGKISSIYVRDGAVHVKVTSTSDQMQIDNIDQLNFVFGPAEMIGKSIVS
jgi:archaellum component FlaC